MLVGAAQFGRSIGGSLRAVNAVGPMGLEFQGNRRQHWMTLVEYTVLGLANSRDSLSPPLVIPLTCMVYEARQVC